MSAVLGEDTRREATEAKAAHEKSNENINESDAHAL